MLLSEKNTLDIAYKEKDKALKQIDKCYKDLERVEKTIKEIEEAMGVDLPIRFPDKWHEK